MHPAVASVNSRILQLVSLRWRFSKIREYMRDSVNVNRVALRSNVHPDTVRLIVEQELESVLTKGAAVYVVLSGNRLGTRSSLAELARRATNHYGDAVTSATAGFYRCAYRKANNLTEDCRTYATQHKRDMRRRDYTPRNARQHARTR